MSSVPPQEVAAFRQFSRYFTRHTGVLAGQYLGQRRPLGAARVLFEIGSGTSLRELRTRLGLDPGYLSRVIRSLEVEGLVRVSPHPSDGRLRVAGLTPAGEAELAEQDRRANGVAEGLLGTLAEGQRRELAAALGTAQRLLRLAGVSVQAADPLSAAARGCLAAYVAVLRERFPEGFAETDLARPQELQGDTGVFLIAYEDSRPVGCGALRTLEPGTGEIRHMWVAAGARGLGIGRRLLTALEGEAAARGLGTVRLGTHRALTEAVQMYRSSGYTEIPQYGQDPHTHYWFEKRQHQPSLSGQRQSEYGLGICRVWPRVRRMDIVILLFDRFEPLDAIGPYEILAHVPGAKVRFVAPESGRITDVLGSLPVDVPTRCSDVEACDVLLVPGGGGVWSLLEDQDFLGWVRRVHATTRFTASVCTGSLLLAAAGLLDGLTAATHWGTAGEIEGYGAVYTPKRVVRHDRIITSAGVASGIDMALHLAALLADETTAQAIQLYTEYDPQPPFDSGSMAKASPEVLERARALGFASPEVLERARTGS